MGALLSSYNNRPRSFSGRLYKSASKLGRQRRASNPPASKRTSINRPVLRLQIKPETLDRQKRNSNGRNGTTIHVTRGALRSLTRDSAPYDHLIPRTNSSAHSTTIPAHNRQHSSDSMVVVQFVENGRYDPSTTEKDENDYDRLLPSGDCERLCTCTYGRVSPAASRVEEEEQDSHLTTIHIGPVGRRQLPHQLSVSELQERIIQHIPAEAGRHRRSKSTTAISSYRLDYSSDSLYTRQRLTQSTTCLDDIDDLGLEWSLGESILKALSRNDITIFNIEDPQHESEKEVNRAWPELKDKMKIWKQSQSSINLLDATREPDVFTTSM